MSKKNIAIITGGDSAEDVISFQSAELISNEIDKGLYNTFIIHIKGNSWKVISDNFGEIQINKNDFSCVNDNKKILFDCAFIAIHGTPGENGILQAYFEIVGIPYTTSGVLSSALTFNKFACKTYLRNLNIPTAKTILIKEKNNYKTQEILDTAGLPCFVKPNQGGSSFGISKVTDPKDLKSAIDLAFLEDNEVIIEEFIDGIEITCGLVVLDNNEIVFPLTEIVSKNEFFDYEAKYTPEMADEITPARISGELELECKKISLEIYKKTNCKGIVRIDYIYSNNKLYFLEVNNVPGMTANSLVPKQVREMGMDIKDLFSLVIEDSIKSNI